jgi:hypothetical protein
LCQDLHAEGVMGEKRLMVSDVEHDECVSISYPEARVNGRPP